MSQKTMPRTCPGCQHLLIVVGLACENCGTDVTGRYSLPVLARLDSEDQAFALSFLKASGSLKGLARQYGISYPTVRNRLDALIDKIKRLEAETA